MTLKPWHQVVKLHKDIRLGRFTQDQFAARLHDVLIPDKDNEYTNPRMFFDRTHLTEGLESLLREVMDRMEGVGDVPSVLQILTPFGGGKTHALLALYHTIKNGKELEGHSSLERLTMARGKNTFPSAPVAVIDGNQLGADRYRYPEGMEIQTLWGHIAYQLMGKEGYEIVAENDRNRRCPSGEVIDKLLSSCGKGLILLDEVVNYMETAAAIEVLDSTLLFQSRTFLQILTNNVGKHPRFAVVGTLPKSYLEVHGEASREELERLKHIFSRVQNLREPVKGEEIYAIIRRRLFADVGKRTVHQDIANAYMEDYKNRANLPEEVRKTDYREKIIKSYPFHPFTIDIFIRHVATNPGFQKTRGALRLLGLVVSDLWKKKTADALIHAGDIDLNHDEIRNELVELVDREFRNVLEADIVGKGANAPLLDKENGGDHEVYSVAQGLATIAFLYTLEKGRMSVGVSENELHLGIARPNLSKSVIFDSMRSLGAKLHFIQVDGGRYKFDIHPNLPGIIHDIKTRSVIDDDVRDRIKTEIDSRLGRVPFHVYQWVESHNDVPDTPHPKLVLIPTKYPWGEHGDFRNSEEFAMQIADRAGKGRRINRNTLVYLFADHKELPNLYNAVRDLIAVEKVKINRDKYNLTKHQNQQLDDLDERMKKGIFGAILRTFRYTGWVAPEGNKLRVESRGRESASRDKNISDYVLTYLREKKKYVQALTPILLTKFDKFKIWPPEDMALHLKDLPGYFRQYTHLPILSNDVILKKTVADGVTAGFFGYAVGEDENNLEVLSFKERMTPDEVKLEEGYYIIRSQLAEELIKKKKVEEEKRKREEEGVPPLVEEESFELISGEVTVGGKKEEKEGKTKPEAPVHSGPKPLTKVFVDCEVPYSEFYNFFNGVIKPLGNTGDRIKLKINIEAQKAEGFNPNVIEDTVKETLYSIFKSEDAFRGE